ncbi:DUF5060 domain-containing protein [Rubripirellula reticaptiva]|uniref:DUF5060 domain-containing protein n=1 Tax=Rubripirellula reticaptiva TaxID=2528013 RepID=A0A5C6ENI3_9BACT|nr:DUF5060 domain-containing protein [Rubripirellula reticaptiva]TWU49156.1 hypothetical protein Poly59_37700 [Rubripirellula reticaptiva]
MKRLRLFLSMFVLATSAHADDVVFQETGGIVAVEAEHYADQTQVDTRAFYLFSETEDSGIEPDGDPSHAAGASGGAYLEVLPDTRRTHGDKLIRGTNFAPMPGKLAVLNYKVNFATPGKYYVWVRAYSTGSEDNGLHVGIDGDWPESGQRMQWCEGKNSWRWESKQRTEKDHCGEPYKLFLNVATAGEHTISFSMREDGFEFDKWLMTMDRDFARPDDAGPATKLHSGTLPAPGTLVAKPVRDTAATQNPAKNIGGTLTLAAADFNIEGTGYYLDQGKWMAINPDKRQSGTASMTLPYPTGRYDVTLRAVGESDGKSTYTLKLDDQVLGDFTCPLSTQTYEEGSSFQSTWKNIEVTDGTVLSVTSTIASDDGKEYSRARWAAVDFKPADDATRKVAASLLALARANNKPNAPNVSAERKSSPTKSVSDLPLMLPRSSDGDGSVTVSGETKQWHKVTLTMNGPYAHEQDNAPNPFTDHSMSVTFKHSDGTEYTVPGYFAADGDAVNTSAEFGTAWRAHFAPDRTGTWNYTVSFRSGKLAALNGGGKSFAPFDSKSGTLTITESDKSGRDLRAHGRLDYIGKHYLKFAGSGEYFLKAGADAPETLLGYADFDNTIASKIKKKVPLKTWAPHVKDWQAGDPTWQGDKGKGLIGAINYLSGKGCNAFSFLTYNAGGDGDNVWPFIHRDDKLHYDCSKLDQWGVVFDHGTAKGMYLHFKMQETENDDKIPESLDGGDLGVQRKLYCRELIARYAHNLALNWNISEENTQSTAQIRAMLDYIAGLDAYQHNRVTHTFPNEQDKQYVPLLGEKSSLTGVSLQNSAIADTHWQVVKWTEASAAAGKPWVVAFDESGTAGHGQSPDLGYRGFDGHDKTGKMTYTQHEVRKQTLWGTLMGGGAGVEYYFGYQYEENDLLCEDWRSRDQSWDYCRIAINFFSNNKIPFWEMTNQDVLVGNAKHDNSKFCLAKQNDVYVVYLSSGGSAAIDLSEATGIFKVEWFNPRSGGDMQTGSVATVEGGASASLGLPPSDLKEDWVVVLRR